MRSCTRAMASVGSQVMTVAVPTGLPEASRQVLRSPATARMPRSGGRISNGTFAAPVFAHS